MFGTLGQSGAKQNISLLDGLEQHRSHGLRKKFLTKLSLRSSLCFALACARHAPIQKTGKELDKLTKTLTVCRLFWSEALEVGFWGLSSERSVSTESGFVCEWMLLKRKPRRLPSCPSCHPKAYFRNKAAKKSPMQWPLPPC
eukprot:780962-Amphidinium_carterae.1